jgi:hypothetical protein
MAESTGEKREVFVWEKGSTATDGQSSQPIVSDLIVAGTVTGRDIAMAEQAAHVSDEAAGGNASRSLLDVASRDERAQERGTAKRNKYYNIRRKKKTKKKRRNKKRRRERRSERTGGGVARNWRVAPSLSPFSRLIFLFFLFFLTSKIFLRQEKLQGP